MATRFEHYTRFYAGDLSLKLTMATSLYERHGEMIKAQPKVATKLAAANDAERAVSTQMATMNLGARCAQCAIQPGGGCCSSFMANENDVLQLLMNLLVGKEVKIQHDNTVDCGLLGTAGCTLTFKPLFCLNYLCSQIKENEESASLTQLEQRTGELLQAQLVLEQLLLDFFINLPEQLQ